MQQTKQVLSMRARKARRDIGVSQTRAANDNGVSRGVIQRLESPDGECPDALFFSRYAAYLHVSQRWLLGQAAESIVLTDDQRAALKLYDALDENGRAVAKMMMREAAEVMRMGRTIEN